MSTAPSLVPETPEFHPKPDPDSETNPNIRSDTDTQADDVGRFNDLLEQHSRELSTTIRVMEEQRRYLRQIEEERKGAYALLTQAMKAVAETARATNAATEKETTPRAQTNMAFEKNRQALAELDAVIAFLRANFLCWQSAWQRYMDTRETERNLSKELVEPRY